MKVKWTEFALAQFIDVVDRLVETRSVAARTRISGRVLQRVAALEDVPWSGPEWRPANDPTFRRLVVEDYVVLYRVSEADQSVYILSVRHGRQRPLDPDDVPNR